MELLRCAVQEYAWGDTESIPHLLGTNPDGKPKAELWMGAHPRACSHCFDGTSLADIISADPVAALGGGAAERFGQLPFLFKVLAAGQPLSIQSHPTLEQAIEGFARENTEGIPLDASHRVYRDPNHKPELIAALTPFHAKCGFRPLAESRQLFSQMVSAGGAQALEPVVEILFGNDDPSTAYQEALAYILGAPESVEAAVAEATVEGALVLLGVKVAEPFHPELEWTGRISNAFPGDSGVTVALMLNHVVLEPGEAVFLEAGNLHAYLSGVGMELMANSDNVVRGGLTPKHRDVAELLKVVDCTPIDVPIQRPTDENWTYDSPVPEFTLDRLVGDGFSAGSTDLRSPQILFVQSGTAEVEGASELSLSAGDVLWISASDGPYSLTVDGTLWRARL